MSKRGMPWMMFFPGDWLSDAVAGCSPAAKGIWIDMLCVMHGAQRYGYLESEGKPIPDELMFRRCGCGSVEEYRNLLAELFSAGVPSRTQEGVIYNRRMVRDQSERDATAKRVRLHRQRVACNAPVTPEYAVEVISQKSEVRENKTPAAAPPVRVDDTTLPIADGFERFYAAYPRKLARDDAEKAWRQKVKPEEVSAILARIEVNKLGEWKDQEKRFIPYPASWLRGRRWKDEIEKGGRNGNGSAAAVRPAAGKYAAISITRATA